MKSEIKEFYENKVIFLTGGSGFLGKVIIEKLLRTTEVSRIYVLMRYNRAKSRQERIDEWKTNPLFGLLLESKPNALDRVVAIAGNCKESDLDISNEDRELLKEETHVVIHSAATVNFAEPLHVAVDTNTRATRLVLQLAKEMPHLVAFVHISSAFSNCVIHHLEERFYPSHLNSTADQVIKLREIFDNDTFDAMESILRNKFPNTYTYTKALAEQVIQAESGEMPVCILRPGAIVATSREPIPGWIDKIQGQFTVIYGTAIGALRAAPINDKALSSIVPVDHCASLIIAMAWQTAKETDERNAETTPADPKIYNYVPHHRNLLSNGNLYNGIQNHRFNCPTMEALWYPYLIPTSIFWVYKVMAFFAHLLPGYLIDLRLRWRGEEPHMIKMYEKMHNTIDALAPFSTHNWSFDTVNSELLWKSMSQTDKQLFHFDMRSLKWEDYFLRTLFGIRLYLGKEEQGAESQKQALQHLYRLRIGHHIVLSCLFGCFFGIVKLSMDLLKIFNDNYNVGPLLR